MTNSARLADQGLKREAPGSQTEGAAAPLPVTLRYDYGRAAA
jgi:hypothetical protein